MEELKNFFGGIDIKIIIIGRGGGGSGGCGGCGGCTGCGGGCGGD